MRKLFYISILFLFSSFFYNIFAQSNFTVKWESGWYNQINLTQWETNDIDNDSYIEICLVVYNYNTSKEDLIILSTTSHVIAVNNNSSPVPGFNLGQNYPNPFNPSTTINYSIEKEGSVQLELYNNIGQLLKVYSEGNKNAGSYILKIDASNFASGPYFYRLIVNGNPETKKMVLIK